MQIIPNQQDLTFKDDLKDDPIHIVPISSGSLLVVFGDKIEIAINEKVKALHLLLKQNKLPWITEMTPAYASLGINFNLHYIKTNYVIEGLVFDWVKKTISDLAKDGLVFTENIEEIVEIPVCFENNILQNDLHLMVENLQLPAKEIIDIFLNKTYHVFMLGFLPGFTYMGEIDDRIAVKRKKTPTPIKAGAVGIAGKQTGVYPLESLGGWHIVGHTPFKMFDPTNVQPNFLKVGDKIKFIQITE